MTNPCRDGSPLVSQASARCQTVQRMGWAGFGNGEVLRLAAAHGFDAFVTTDRGIAHQQHLADLPVPVIVMTAFRTRIQELAPLVPRIAGIVAGGLRKDIYLVCAPGLEDQDGRRQR